MFGVQHLTDRSAFHTDGSPRAGTLCILFEVHSVLQSPRVPRRTPKVQTPQPCVY